MAGLQKSYFSDITRLSQLCFWAPTCFLTPSFALLKGPPSRFTFPHFYFFLCHLLYSFFAFLSVFLSVLHIHLMSFPQMALKCATEDGIMEAVGVLVTELALGAGWGSKALCLGQGNTPQLGPLTVWKGKKARCAF